MAKIDTSDSNKFPWPKGAYIGNKNSGAVYINVSNEYVPPDEKIKEPGTRGYTGHKKQCIGKVLDLSATKHSFFYPNPFYRTNYLHLDLPEPPRLSDCLSIGLHGWISEASVISGLTSTLEEVFGDDAYQILDLAHYMISKESAVMQHYPAWARDNMIFSSDIMNDTEIGQFLKEKLSVSKINQFKYKWAVLNLKEGTVYLCYDSTNVNCQATGVSIVQRGHAKDDPSLPQVNTDYVIRQSDGMPITYMHSPGSVTDIAQAQEMIDFFKELGEKLGKEIKIVLICDRGYISEKNLRLMDKAGIEYILMLRSNFNLHKELADKYIDQIRSYEYKLTTSDDSEEKFGLTTQCDFYEGGKKCFAHVLWSEKLYRSNRNAVDKSIEGKRQSVINFISTNQNASFTNEELDKLLPRHLFNLDLEDAGIRDVERKEGRGRGVRIVIDKVPVFRVKGFSDNKAAINKEREKSGIYILISSQEMTAQEAIDAYAKRDCVEKAFEALKSHLGMDKIGVTTEEAMHGKGLVWFIASILYSVLHKRTEEFRIKDKKNYTVPVMVDKLEAIKADRDIDKKIYKRRYKITKHQDDILKNWEISETKIDEIIDILNAG